MDRWKRRGGSEARRPSEPQQPWYDAFRQEYNEERPHEALGMKTPASVWHRSERRYQANPAEWEYEAGAEVRRLQSQGQLTVRREAVGDQQGAGWGIGAADPHGRQDLGVLLPQPGARTRPAPPTVHRGGPLVVRPRPRKV